MLIPTVTVLPVLSRRRPLPFWLPLLIGLYISGCGPAAEIQELSGQQQGTTYHIKVVLDPKKIQ